MGGSNLLSLIFGIDADPSAANAKLAAFQEQLKGSGGVAAGVFRGAGEAAGTFGEAVTRGGAKAEEGLLGARESTRLLMEDFGIRLPRSITTAISNIGGMGEALSALAPIMIGVFAAKELPHFLEWIDDVMNDSKAIAAAWSETQAEIKKADDEMNRLDEQHLQNQRDISLIGLDQVTADKRRLDYAKDDLALGAEDAQNAKDRLDAAEKHLESLRQQRDQLEKMMNSTRLMDAANNTIASYRMPKATAAVKEQEASVAKLREQWELADTKARNLNDNVEKLSKTLGVDVADAAQKGADAIGRADDKSRSFLDRWAAAKTEFPKLRGELESIPAIIDQINKEAASQDFKRFVAFLAGDYKEAGFEVPKNAPLGGMPDAMATTVSALTVSMGQLKMAATGPWLAQLPGPFTALNKALLSSDPLVRGLGAVLKNLGQSDMQAAVQSFGKMDAAVRTFGLNAKEAMGQFGSAMETEIAAAIMGQKHLGKALEMALKEELANLAARAAVHAIYETAVGFGYLAIHDYPSADLAFTSAAIYAGVAAAFGGAAAAMPGAKGGGGSAGGSGGAGGGGGGQAGGGYGGSFASGSLFEQAASGSPGGGGSGRVNISGKLIFINAGPREAAQHLAGILKTGVEHYDVDLPSSRARMMPTVGQGKSR